ncbi:MAG: riboflavin synthase [Panacagrimonas sp.]|nr:riboflavin synthase [Panacagrimonas sp.]MCC2658628.1 riboflavin synthase [Panacagrimonas sp.]
MFTGIIESVGRIVSIEPRGGDVRMHIEAQDAYLADTALGDSVAVGGICLTVREKTAQGFTADLSVETLQATSSGGWAAGRRVNLEKALTPHKPLGGHLVSGHVDGVGTLVERRQEARSWRMQFEAPDALARYIARKGSITIDGISLTVNDVEGRVFGVNIIPHTLDQTTLGDLQPGDAVNLEVDLIARYLERLLQARETP